MPNAEAQSSVSLGLSVIVPLLNELAALPQLKANLDVLNAEQILLVDGGSEDGTLGWIADNWQKDSLTLVKTNAGRANQMNMGAAEANQAMLLFLHADTQLPNDAKAQICSLVVKQHKNPVRWGRFDVKFSASSRAMRVIAWFINWRSRLTSVATGDQAIFVHRQLFDQVAGFDAIPLMEDVAICKKLRRVQTPLNCRSRVITSARRWEKQGVLPTVLKMWWFRFAYFIGVSPNYLAKSYRNVRR